MTRGSGRVRNSRTSGRKFSRIDEFAEGVVAGIAESAESGARVEGDPGPAAGALEVEATMAQKGEIVVVNPIQEGTDLVAVVGRNRTRLGREFLHRLADLTPRMACQSATVVRTLSRIRSMAPAISGRRDADCG